ncbi:MAG: RNA-binding S4 domain-containing protein [Bacteroidetes bacterium]|nr:MAG: RNA-binding S4 domain-containing protein [Bacteroidota bacterium]
MEKIDFKLEEGSEYIELIALLKALGIAQTGGHAKMIVAEGEVRLNGARELRKRAKLRDGDLVTIDSYEIRITA